MNSCIFKFRQFDVCQDFEGMKVGSDGVMLGAWAKGGSRILDVGTGTGLIALMMAQRYPDAELLAIDISESAFKQARVNFSNSKFADRIGVEHTSVQNLYADKLFDAIVTNPPFFIDSLKNPNQIMAVRVPVEDAADLMQRAAQVGMPTDEYLGILVLSGAYGAAHPIVKEFRNRPNQGVSGPKTPEQEEDQ